MRADPTLAKRSPELELVEACRMHNRIAHGYETLNWTRVWVTATEDVPRLAEAVRAWLDANPE